uniref:Uncharacterized protein n=1 Tax=Bracon brevicornis TaxID=1563983 RepID=A0A6V7K7T6_9HYME
MVVSESEDTLTRINTALNRSMVLMEDKGRLSENTKPNEKKSRKSIKINTGAVRATSTPLLDQNTTRKSILKKTDRNENPVESPKRYSVNGIVAQEKESDVNNFHNRSTEMIGRPHNLDELTASDELLLDPSEQTYTMEDVGPDDELWIVDIPKSINPHDLKGQVLNLGDKTKLKIGTEKFQAVGHQTSECLTFVFGTGRETKPFKTVNLRPSGTITLRRRLTSAGKNTQGSSHTTEESNVPHFPKGLKRRDPLVGMLPQSRTITKKHKKSKSHLRQASS